MSVLRLVFLRCDPCGAFLDDSMSPGSLASQRATAKASGWAMNGRNVATCPDCLGVTPEVLPRSRWGWFPPGPAAICQRPGCRHRVEQHDGSEAQQCQACGCPEWLGHWHPPLVAT